MSDHVVGSGGHAVGERIGPGILLEYAGRNGHRHHLWMWRCVSCDETRGPSTLAHLRRSSRCQECALARENNPRWKGHQGISGRYLWCLRDGAEERGIAFEVTPEYLWEIWLSQEEKCAYSGLPLTQDVDASVDRKDNTKGYVYGNVQWVHKDVNRMKTDFGHDYFVGMCRIIAGFAVPTVMADFAR